MTALQKRNVIFAVVSLLALFLLGNLLFTKRVQKIDNTPAVPENPLTREIISLKNEQYMLKEKVAELDDYRTYASERIELMGHVISHAYTQALIKSKEEPHTTFCKSTRYTHQIALIVPTMYDKSKNQPFENHLLFNVLIKSLLKSATKGFKYKFYLAFNEGDPLFGQPAIFHSLFSNALLKHKYSCSSKFQIDYMLVPISPKCTGSKALSILFAVPTLVAYSDNSDYFYLVNDDLNLQSAGWTEKFVNTLSQNPLYSNFGIIGGEDVSGSQPFLEFPFFHRVHVDIFANFGAHPWIFRNWFEDNWLSDVYLPFNSTFYLHDVKVANYDTLDIKDARYEIVNKAVPKFFVNEVEQGRRFLRDWLVARKVALPSSMDLGYCTVKGASLVEDPIQERNPCKQK